MKAKINGIGEIIFCNKKIFNVIYLDTFPINLLSVKKLTQELNCDVIFSCKNVVFQDRETGTKIGEGFLENGHYLLNSKIIFCASAKIVNSDLWHKRLGHPSDKILNSILDFKNLNCSNCEICKLAKQTKLHFSLSTNKSKTPLI